MSTTEVLLHINEDLTPSQREDFLLNLGNRPNGIHAEHHSDKSHLMFVAYDPSELCPHDLVAMAEDVGVHAQVVDL